jgi:site-specific DNA-cytosine methylase
MPILEEGVDDMANKQLTFIDFFSGIGGFRLGFELAGHKCVGSCERDKYAIKSYNAMLRKEYREEYLGGGTKKLSDKYYSIKFEFLDNNIFEVVCKNHSIIMDDKRLEYI